MLACVYVDTQDLVLGDIHGVCVGSNTCCVDAFPEQEGDQDNK